MAVIENQANCAWFLRCAFPKCWRADIVVGRCQLQAPVAARRLQYISDLAGSVGMKRKLKQPGQFNIEGESVTMAQIAKRIKRSVAHVSVRLRSLRQEYGPITWDKLK